MKRVGVLVASALISTGAGLVMAAPASAASAAPATSAAPAASATTESASTVDRRHRGNRHGGRDWRHGRNHDSWGHQYYGDWDDCDDYYGYPSYEDYYRYYSRYSSWEYNGREYRGIGILAFTEF
jgi:Ni/Co efflux regulator RcnB